VHWYTAPSFTLLVSPAMVAAHHALPAWSEVNCKLHSVPVQPTALTLTDGAVCARRRSICCWLDDDALLGAMAAAAAPAAGAA
jgi:hypothetical protein